MGRPKMTEAEKELKASIKEKAGEMVKKVSKKLPGIF